MGLLANDGHAALDAIERALSFNPSSAAAYYLGAFLYARGGDPVTGTAYADRALRLSPFDPLAFHAHIALALAATQEGRYEEAGAYWQKCAQANPSFGGFLFGQAQMLALAGRMGDARTIFARGLALEPEFRIRTIVELGFAPAITDKMIDGARLLGAPE